MDQGEGVEGSDRKEDPLDCLWRLVKSCWERVYAQHETKILKESVDPDILGGLVARVGGVVFDASLTRQLEKMRQRLLAQA